MRALITISMDSEAFRAKPGTELCRILRLLARQIAKDAPSETPLYDSDGVQVGEFGISDRSG